MNRRAATIVGVAVVATFAALAGIYGIPGLSDGGTADAAQTPRFVYEGEQLTFEPAEGQTIHGQTDLSAGTELSVRLRSSGENPFLKSQTATVDDAGAFEATFDLSVVDGGTSFQVVVHHDGSRLMNTTGEVTA